ncbi:carbamoyltransferase C-terminal domain-containing protein [Roseateles chitinivorans]|uniref:carbamoyltransferase C-terminal domain-containing protein n=1 Tax=Roseateles chitinivorans TaxID=2917965 RepID=UPI003D669BAD
MQATQSVYWGSDIGTPEQIEKELTHWADFVSMRRLGDPARETAELLAQGQVIGWMQGRSEFGPRALGNRSILADPRPAENKSKINAMVKKREAYRPFAPSVLEESAAEIFELGGLQRSPYMLFSLPTREASRASLGAVSHVDGSARIQTVSRESNRPYWDLISAFKDLTGVPVLLNTSFNNDAEPIVESVRDGVVCFLTTQLDRLVVGDFLVERRSTEALPWERLVAALADSRQLVQKESLVPPAGRQIQYAIESSYSGHRRLTISEQAYRLLLARQPSHTLGMLLDELGITEEAQRSAALAEFVRLWEQRAVQLRPADVA